MEERSRAEFVRFLVYAHASCDETILHLKLINEMHKIDGNEIDSLINAYEDLGRKINKFIRYVETEWNKNSTCDSLTRNTEHNLKGENYESSISRS